METLKNAFSYVLVRVLSLPWTLLEYWRDQRLRSHYGELANKVILVTGASSGIGRELATQLFKHGAKLILASRSTEKLEALKTELLEQIASPVPVHVPAVLTLDLEQVEHLSEKAAEALRLFGGVDVLVNNGGMSVRGGAVETQLSVHMRLMGVNYFGSMELTRHIVEDMISRGGGMVVNISSVQGRLAIPFRAAYSASKHALQAFSDSLRAEVASAGVHVLVVSPGYVNTELSRNSMTADGQVYNRMDPNTASGYSAEYVASEVIKGILRQDKEIVLAPLMHRVAIVLRAVFPSLYFKIMESRAQKQK